MSHILYFRIDLEWKLEKELPNTINTLIVTDTVKLTELLHGSILLDSTHIAELPTCDVKLYDLKDGIYLITCNIPSKFSQGTVCI